MASTHETLDDFTSRTETPPQRPEAAPLLTTCRYCPETFQGAARYVQRGLHEKRKHPDEFAAAKAGVKPKVKAKKGQHRKPAATKSVTGPVTPPGKKRISAADAIATNLGRIAKIVAQADLPLGRALTFSAPATGVAVDELVAGTVVDRVVVQKFAGLSDKWDKLSGAFAFPVLVAIVSRNPALYDVLESEMRDAALDVIIGSIPSLEKQKVRERKAVDALRRLGQVDERYATAVDPLGLFIKDIFAPAEEPREDAE